MAPDQTLFVGDSADDAGAAAHAGVSFLWAQTFFGWSTPCNREVA
jgi:phosphoglycolate phosphatase-like HAD superfamily hydrolase